MSVPAATFIAALIAVFGNRILAVLAGLWLHVPDGLLLGLLIFLDVVQIPLYYWIYDHGSTIKRHLPARVQKWFERDWSLSAMGRWASAVGGLGIMTVAALPTFGGGIWSGVLIAYHLRMRRAVSFAWLSLGSAISYGVLYWVLDTLVRTVRYFTH